MYMHVLVAHEYTSRRIHLAQNIFIKAQVLEVCFFPPNIGTFTAFCRTVFCQQNLLDNHFCLTNLKAQAVHLAKQTGLVNGPTKSSHLSS